LQTLSLLITFFFFTMHGLTVPRYLSFVDEMLGRWHEKTAKRTRHGRDDEK